MRLQKQVALGAGLFGAVGAGSLFWLWSRKNAQEAYFRKFVDRDEFLHFYHDTIYQMQAPENALDRPRFKQRAKEMQAYAAKYHINLPRYDGS